MRYYCKNCGSELTTPFTENYAELCPHCVTGDGTHKIMERIPDYETLVQYEARTGKPFPDNGLVFTNYLLSEWTSFAWKHVKRLRAPDNRVVIASPLIPPPDNFEPEEGGKQ